MTLLVQAAEVSYAHGANQIFDAVTFEIREGDRLALIGENGAGKSTLFRLMARELRPQGGVVTHRNNLTIGYLSQHSSIDPGLTTWEAVAQAGGDPTAIDARLRELEAQMAEPLDDDGLNAVLEEYGELLSRTDTAPSFDLDARVARVLNGLGIPEERWDVRVGVLSGGEKKLVALAQFLIEEPDLLLLDEPDNHLDADAKIWLEQYLAQRRGSLALISHDRYFIDRVANRIFELEDGVVIGYPGNYSAYQREKRARLERQEELYELRQRDLKKLKASAEQLTQWARQNPKFASRAENRRRMLAVERERLDNTPVPVVDRRRIEMDFTGERGSSLVLELKGLAKSYGEREVFRPFDFTMMHGERVGLVGPNGAGKTTLFRLILGVEEPSAGSLRVGPTITAGYYAQEQETLDPTMTPLDLVRRTKPMTEQQAISFLVGLLFDRGDALNRIGDLSGGERSRLQIAMLILQGSNFLLLDEPTNNLDIPSIEVLEDALLVFGGSILTISHDRYYLDKLCSRTIEIDQGVVREYPGGFTYYDSRRGSGQELTTRVEEQSQGQRETRR
ncbi:MAG TPA: ABC-F family ATP-binding cassette domain-containing protein [Thermomicrobiales bacterium]|nr:ABC-F family ATP-binding cassette domain-containing protein [Thermomicrobiales bacterium]